MSSFTSIYRAAVFDSADPVSRGRARLLIPSILGRTPTGWAEPMQQGGEVSANDIVWAMFENGDLNRPLFLPVVPEQEPFPSLSSQAPAGAKINLTLVYDAGAYPTRPTGNYKIEWHGPVTPVKTSTQAQDGDTWIYTTA